MRARLRMWRARRQRDQLAAWCGITDLSDGELYRAYRIRRQGKSGQHAGDRIRATRAWAKSQPGLRAWAGVQSTRIRPS